MNGDVKREIVGQESIASWLHCQDKMAKQAVAKGSMDCCCVAVELKFSVSSNKVWVGMVVPLAMMESLANRKEASYDESEGADMSEI